MSNVSETSDVKVVLRLSLIEIEGSGREGERGECSGVTELQ